MPSTFIFSAHIWTPPSLLDTLLTGTFNDLQENFRECEEKSKRNHPDLIQHPQHKRRKLPHPSSHSSVLCKSRGRWTSKPKISKYMDIINDKQSLSLRLRWKVNLEKCIDSSPLLISKGNATSLRGRFIIDI